MVTMVNVAKQIAAAVMKYIHIHKRRADAGGHDIYAGGDCREGEDLGGMLGGFFFRFC